VHKLTANLFGLVFLLGSGAAAADLLGSEERTRVATPDRQYLSAMAGFTAVDDDRAENVDEGLHAVGIYGYQFDNNFGVEGSFAAEAVRGAGHRVTAMLDGYYGFANRRAGNAVPYYLAGIGLAHNDIDSDSTTNLAYNIGLGISAPLDDLIGLRLRFRGEARYFHDTVGDGLDDFRVSLGLEVPLFR